MRRAIISLCLLAATAAEASNADLVLDVLAQFRLLGAQCALMVAPKGASCPLSGGQNDVLPIISVTTDAEAKSTMLEARRSCPFYLFHSMSVNATEGFLRDNYDFLRRRFAHYVHFAEEDGDEILELPYFEKVLHAVAITKTAQNGTFAVREKQPCRSVASKLVRTWTPGEGFAPPGSLFSDDLLDDLTCRHITASTFNYPPFAYLHRHENGSVSFTGTEVSG